MASSLLKRTLVLFGLADEEEDAFAETDEVLVPAQRVERDVPPSVRRINRTPDVARAERVAQLRSVGSPQVRVHVIEPIVFSDAQKIADKFKANIPVIVNLQAQEGDMVRRLIDFCSGLTYGMDGGMQRVGERVFLLTPSNVDVSAEERRRLQERGFFHEA